MDYLVTTTVAAKKNQTVWEIKLTNTNPLQAGIMKGELVVETNDPDSPVIKIPFTGLVVAEKGGNINQAPASQGFSRNK